MILTIILVLLLTAAIVSASVILKTKYVISNEVWDALALSIKILGCFQVFWLALAKCWGFSYVTEVGSTIAAVMVLIESILTVTGHTYRHSEEYGLEDIKNGKVKSNIQLEDEYSGRNQHE